MSNRLLMPSSQAPRAATLCVLLAALLAWPSAVAAATFEVNLGADRADADPTDGRCDADINVAGEQCSLRAAAEQVAALSSGIHRIRVTELPIGEAIHIQHGPIQLRAGIHLTGNPERLVPVLAGNSDGESAFRIDDSGDGDVEISGFSIDLSKQRGPAISSLQQGASLRLSDLRIRAANPAVVALQLTGGRLDCLRCRLLDNASTAIVVDGGELRLTDSLVSDNRSDTGGGGLRINDGRVWLQRSEVSRNRSSGDGGGIQQSGGELWLINSLLRGNLAARGGGGLAVSNGIARLQNSSVVGNVANGGARGTDRGGGILTRGEGRTRLRNSIISDNRALAMDSGSECAGTGLVAEAINVIGRDDQCLPRSVETPAVLRTNTPMMTTMRALPWGGLRMLALPPSGHPAIGMGASGCMADGDLDSSTPEQPLQIDLRQQPRPTASGVLRCDLGAVQTRCDQSCMHPRGLAEPSDASLSARMPSLWTPTAAQPSASVLAARGSARP